VRLRERDCVLVRLREIERERLCYSEVERGRERDCVLVRLRERDCVPVRLREIERETVFQ
jgi:translation initiation factor IF-1